jgi:hypothetical protein
MSSEQMKPFRAWMAWHPKHGVESSEFPQTREQAIERLCMSRGYYEDGDFMPGPIHWDDAEKDGWRIVEVEVRGADFKGENV